MIKYFIGGSLELKGLKIHGSGDKIANSTSAYVKESPMDEGFATSRPAGLIIIDFLEL
jgi:hypothetical protein